MRKKWIIDFWLSQLGYWIFGLFIIANGLLKLFEINENQGK